MSTRSMDYETLVKAMRAVLPPECYVTREAGPPFCTDFIGGTIGTGDNTWTAEMCCLPCRVRAALPPTEQPTGPRCRKCGAGVLYASEHLKGGRDPGWKCPPTEEPSDG